MRQGLTLGVNAIELDHKDAWKYTGLKVGNKVALAAAISSTGNWEGATYGSSSYSAPTGFTVNPMPATSPMSSARETPSAPPPPPVYFTVVGPCTVNGACVRSPNYPSDYGNSQSCTITPESPAVGWLLSATAFDTESNWDQLRVNGVDYSGTTGPMGVVLSGAFTWSSDGFSNRDGWEVCAQAAPPTPPPEPPSPPLPPAPPPLPPGVIQMEGCE